MPDPPSSGPPDRPARPSRDLVALVEVAALVLMIAALLAAWVVGIVTRVYDYDEVQRAHSVWLAAQGLRPYNDFFECHPPYFALLTPVFWYSSDPCDALRALRVLAAVGNLLFLGGLAALGASAAPSMRRWALLGLVLVASYPAVLDFLVEYRIDGWGYSLATWSLYRFRRHPRGVWPTFELGVLTGVATLFFSPKLALLPPLILAFEQVRSRESPRGVLRAGVAYLAGAGVAAGLFALYLAWHRIGFEQTSQLLVRYHAVSNAHAAFGFGLLRAILMWRTLFLVIVAGVVGWAVDCSRRRTLPDSYEAGLAAWLVLQALLVTYPFKQYYGPWFLFSSGFLVYLGRGLSDLLGRGRVVVFIAASAAAFFAATWLALIWYDLDAARSQERLIRWMDRVTRPGDRVVASPPDHPIDRPDSFFLWFNTGDPEGFDSERILARLPSYRAYVAEGRFREELEAEPPALVYLGDRPTRSPYTSGQRTALFDFIRRHGYRTIPVGKASVALRPDCYERSRRVGLIE